MPCPRHREACYLCPCAARDSGRLMALPPLVLAGPIRRRARESPQMRQAQAQSQSVPLDELVRPP